MSLLIAGQGSSYPGETVSGDAWTHFAINGGTRIVLIDGAGHGPLAQHAAETAKTALEELAGHSAESALRVVHSRLHGTRGAVISTVDILESTMSFTGVGNIDGRLFLPGAPQHRFAPDRGLLGASLPRLHTWTFPIEGRDWRLILFSDGIMQRMSLEWTDLEDLSALDDLLKGLVERWGRNTDDATIVLAAPRP